MFRPATKIMRFRLPSLRLLALCVLLVPLAAAAQDDAPSLGDLARNLRKNKSDPQQASDSAHPVAGQTVIDNDNLTQIMEDAKNARPIREDKTIFSIDPSGNT